ncbi:MAG: hypothetical protein IJB92_04500 [Clostridia bacterium]|nr:hypothetical protein [Clostridia bacterium]
MKELIMSLCALAFIKTLAGLLFENSGFLDITDMCIGFIACAQVMGFVYNIFL